MGTPSRISDFEYDADAPAPLRFERRANDRWPVQGVAKTFRVAGERFGEMQVLKMIDYSWDGLGAFCPEPLEPGTIVSLGFQEPGYMTKRGVVLRCLPCGDGYRVAIQFESLLAA